MLPHALWTSNNRPVLHVASIHRDKTTREIRSARPTAMSTGQAVASAVDRLAKGLRGGVADHAIKVFGLDMWQLSY